MKVLTLNIHSHSRIHDEQAYRDMIYLFSEWTVREGIDVIVHLGRLRDHRRVVLDVEELYLSENGQIALHPLFTYDRTKGLVRTGNTLRDRTKWERNGGSMEWM